MTATEESYARLMHAYTADKLHHVARKTEPVTRPNNPSGRLSWTKPSPRAPGPDAIEVTMARLSLSAEPAPRSRRVAGGDVGSRIERRDGLGKGGGSTGCIVQARKTLNRHGLRLTLEGTRDIV